MKSQILLLSLLACSSKPVPSKVDTSHSSDTVSVEATPDTPALTAPSKLSSGKVDIPESCTTIMENRDDWIAPKEKELRVKICNLTGIDQGGNEFSLYDFLGEVVVLIIMDSTCEECIAWLDNDGPYQMLAPYEVKTVNVITRNKYRTWASPSDVAALHSDYNLSNYPVLAVDPRVIGYAPEQFQPFRNHIFSPMFYIIDKDMRLAWSSVPYDRWLDDFHGWHEWRLPVGDLTLE